MGKMNRYDDYKATMKLSDDVSESDKIVPLTLQSASKMWLTKEEDTEDGGIEQRSKNKKKWKSFTVEELRMQVEDPAVAKEKRILGIKKRYGVVPSINPINTLDDIRYRTTHPKKLQAIVQQAAGPPSTNGVKKKFELSKQDAMIKAQGQDLTTKKYQLLHSDLRKLLRSTSAPTGSSNSGSGSSPTNTTAANNPNTTSPSRAVTLSV